MKTNKILSFAMMLLLSVSLISCGSDNETSGSGVTTTNTFSGVPTSSTGLSAIENFQNNVANGNFKAQKYTDSKFDYLKEGGYSTSSSSYDSYFYCNIPLICDSGNSGGSSNVSRDSIMNRSIQTNGTISREAIDTGLSIYPSNLKQDLVNKIQAARNRSYSRDVFFMQTRANAFIFKPGDGFEYIVDLDYPLAANPVFRRALEDIDGTTIRQGDVYRFYLEYRF